MRPLTRFAAVASVTTIAFAATTCQAAPASPESVHRLMLLLHKDKVSWDDGNETHSRLQEEISTDIVPDTISAADRSRIQEMIRQLNEMTRQLAAGSAPEFQLAPLYAAAFSQEEIDGQIAFYSTPVGQAVIEKTPEVMTKVGELMTMRFQALMAAHFAIMDELIKAQTRAKAASRADSSSQPAPASN